MADQEQVLADARQAMVRLVREMKGFMDNRPEREVFNQLMDRSVPEMRDQLEQNSELSDAELVARIQATQSLGWEERTAQMIRHPGYPPAMFADPAVNQAVGTYISREEGVRALNLAAAAQPRREERTQAVNLAAGATRPTRSSIGRAPAAGYDTARAASVLQALEGRPAAPPARPAPTRPSPAPAGPRQQPQQPGPTTTPPRSQGPAAPTPPQPRSSQVAQPGQPSQQPQGSPPSPAQPQPSRPQAPTAGPAGGAGPAPSQQSVGPSPAADGRRAAELNVDLMGTAGSVVVRADPECRRPTMTIRTADATGLAADGGDGITPTPDSLQPSVQATDSRSGGSRVIFGDDHGVAGGRVSREIVFNGDVEIGGSVVMGDQDGITGGQFTGDVVMSGRGDFEVSGGDGFEISGGGLHISGSEIGTVDIGPGTVKIDSISNSTITVSRAASPIEVTAVVPEGTSVRSRTEFAHIATEGRLDKVDVKSERGNVVVNRADGTASANAVDSNPGRANSVIAKSVRGDVTVENAGGNTRAEAADGDVTVNATAPGQVKVGSLSGKVTVTASSPEVAEQLKVQDADGRGEVPVTLRGAGAASSRGSDGARDYNDAGRTGQQRQTGNTLGA